MKTLILRITFVLATLSHAVTGQEVLFHEGPKVSTSVEVFAPSGTNSEELVFQKQFFIDRLVLARLSQSGAPLKVHSISAVDALRAAEGSVDLGQQKRFRVIRLEQLKSNTPSPIDFYLIEMLVNGSTEHRIVLMDGTVLKPRLKKS